MEYLSNHWSNKNEVLEIKMTFNNIMEDLKCKKNGIRLDSQQRAQLVHGQNLIFMPFNMKLVLVSKFSPYVHPGQWNILTVQNKRA